MNPYHAWTSFASIVLATMLAGTVAGAEPLTLADSIRLADAGNETAEGARLRARRADAHLREVRAALLPQVQLSGQANQVSAERRPTTGHAYGQVQGDAGITLGVFDPAAWNLTAGASETRRAVHLDATEERRALAFAVTDAYLEQIEADSITRAAKQRREIAEQALARLVTSIQQGAAAPNDRARQDLDVASARLVEIQVQQRLDAAIATLAEVIHGDPRQSLVMPEALLPPTENIDELVTYSVRERSDLHALRYRIRAAGRQTDAERSNYLPRVQVAARVNDERLFGGYPADSERESASWSVGLEATWSIFDGGGREARVEQRSLEARQAALDSSAAQRRIVTDLTTATRYLAAARAAADEAESRLRFADIYLTDVETKQAQGQSTALELSEARVQRFVSQTDVTRAQIAIRRAAFQIRRIVGRWPLDDIQLSEGQTKAGSGVVLGRD